MRLKKRKKKEERPDDICSASRCKAKPTTTEPAGKIDSVVVYLCDKHWQAHCDEDPPDAAEVAAIETAGREAYAEAPGEVSTGEWVFQHTNEGLRVIK